MEFSVTCKTEQCCKKHRRRRGCTYAVGGLKNRHLTLGKPGQQNPVSPSQYSAARENVYVDCLIKVSAYASSQNRQRDDLAIVQSTTVTELVVLL